MVESFQGSHHHGNPATSAARYPALETKSIFTLLGKRSYSSFVKSSESDPTPLSASSSWLWAGLFVLFCLSITLSLHFSLKGRFGRSARGLSQVQAERIALHQVPGGKLGSEEERLANGRLTWMIDVHLPNSEDLQEVSIDAKNGHIIDVRLETAAEESLEIAAEDHRLGPGTSRTP